ncbi:MAG: pyridoxal-dependent decarboxylase, partial [Actinomycetia bacterium]|nr:pyridoxal-dependent decarboxylase [Actinomycetes bacterium]
GHLRRLGGLSRLGLDRWRGRLGVDLDPHEVGSDRHDVAGLAASEGLWFHADGAYGGGFWLTERGRELLAGIEHADSLTLDPHKSLFLPYGTGLLLVRDEARLRAAHTADADYLQDLAVSDEIADFSDLGPELTRDSRGLRLWLPLHLHGVDAFRAALDEKIDLARWAYAELASDAGVEMLLRPDLTVLVFRSPHGEESSREMLRRINAGRRVFLSSTKIAGEFALRMCVLSHRTHREHVERAVAEGRAAAQACRQR